jgi:glycosyltransferase involved in cell wall biosynthesis
MVLTVHDMHQDLSKVAEKYEQVCCISEAVYADIHLRYPTLNPCRVDNGIVVSRISTDADRPPSSVLRAVQVSRLLHEKKGQDILIRAIAELNAKHASPFLTVDFIGDGPSMSYLCALADELGVRAQCNFLGACSREHVYTNLCNYDMLIQPSRYEGFGLTVAEGMAAGIPVVVSNIEGPMEIINGGKHGYFFKSDNVAALVQALEDVSANLRSGVASHMVLEAQHYVTAKYGLQQSAQKYVAIYSAVVNSSQAIV